MSIKTTPPWPYYEQDEIDIVAETLASGRVNYWTGDQGKRLEQEFAEFHGVNHSIALANGTVALELALLALDIGPGDEVIVTPRTFLASASCVVARGATPVFADIDEVSENISAATIDAAITSATRAIITVHHAGWPCEMNEIMSLAERHSLYVIEDCAQAHGAMYKGRPVGGLGHVAAWSFCQDKIMTTGGEGGMLTTNDATLWKKAWSYKDHGKNYDSVFNKDHPLGFRWLHDSFGTNWRLTEMQSAIARLQLGKLPKWSLKRNTIANSYASMLETHGCVRVSRVPQHIRHAYYRYYFHIVPDRLKDSWSRERIMQEASDEGVPIFTGSCPEIYREKAFAHMSSAPIAPLPIAEKLGTTSLALLTHPTLDTDFVNHVCDILNDVLSRATAQ